MRAPRPSGGCRRLFHVGGGIYYAVSDDRGERGPARYYTFSINITDGDLEADEPDRENQWEELLDPDGNPLPPGTFDLEGLVAHGQSVFVSSEGVAAEGIPPFVAVFGPDARMLERLGLPEGFAPAADGSSGVRNNAAFEGLAITPDGRYLFAATETALAPGRAPGDPPRRARPPASSATIAAPASFDAQFAYPVEPVHLPSSGGGLAVTGVVELLALDAGHLLALERSFVAGAEQQHSIKLFEVCLGDATDISAVVSLAGDEGATVQPVGKRLVADIADLVPRVDNLEGMTFGPDLPLRGAHLAAGQRQQLRPRASDNPGAGVRGERRRTAGAAADPAAASEVHGVARLA